MLIQDIAQYVVDERTRPLPAEVLHHAKRVVVDWFAATAPGGLAMPAVGLKKVYGEQLGHGDARLFPTGERAALRAAAVINAAASHTAELDDIFRDALYHPGVTTIPAALAVAETEDASGEQLLRAIVSGYEVATRIARVMGRAHYRYWHNTATNGSFASAVAAASLLALDRVQIANAIGLAGTMAAGLQQSFRADSHGKPMHAAHAVDSGLLCALSAAQGVTGALDILEGEAGYGAAMSEDCDWQLATAGLGNDYNITRVTNKRHACCGHAFAAIDAALVLRSQHDLRAENVEAIRVGGYSATLDVCGKNRHATPFEGKFSVPYLVATALTHGEVGLNAFTEERLHHPDTATLAKSTELYLDASIDAEFPARRAARVQIETSDGALLERYQPTRRGDPDAPLDDAELGSKFMSTVTPACGEALAAALLDACWQLDRLDSVRELPMGDLGPSDNRAPLTPLSSEKVQG
ncbi:MAG: MmgE/PrpD family protein [Gammaproteobacteria bacterium]|nr:MmgE/PrpD family protein [Gammaproteobacteria bacterium]